MALDALIGYGAGIGLRLESTWGTSAGLPTKWLPVTSITPRVELGITPIPYLSLADAAAYHNYRDAVQLMHDATLEITGCCSYDDGGFTMLLVHALGAVSTTGAGPFTHTITCDTDGIVGITINVIKGQGIATRSETYTGGRITRFEFEINARGWATWRATVICKSAGGAIEPVDTAAYVAAEEILGHHGQAAGFSWSGNSVVPRRFKFVVDNNLQRRPQIGSLLTDIPVPGGHASITWEADRSYEDHAVYTDFLSGLTSQGNLTYTFTGTSPNSFAITLHNALVTGYSAPVDRAGELVQRISGIALQGASTQGLQIVVINANSSAV